MARSNSKSNSTLKERERYGKTLNIVTELNDYTFLVTGSSNSIRRNDDGAGNDGLGKTSTLHVHHIFFVDFLAVVERLPRETSQ